MRFVASGTSYSLFPELRLAETHASGLVTLRSRSLSLGSVVADGLNRALRLDRRDLERAQASFEIVSFSVTFTALHGAFRSRCPLEQTPAR